MIALGQGGQALDMDAEESAEGIGLGLAQLRELRGDVLDGAVPLAQLDTDGAVLADGSGAGSVALGAKGVDESPDTVLGSSPAASIWPRTRSSRAPMRWSAKARTAPSPAPSRRKRIASAARPS